MTSDIQLSDKDTALLVIDVQNDFCPGGALAVADGDAVVSPINQMISQSHNVILTQDWHPAGHHSFASAYDDKAPFDMVTLDYGPQVLWPDHCIQGSGGAAFHNQLNIEAAQTIIRKGYRPQIDSYSAFFENDHKTPTGLSGYLETRSVSRLVMCGLATDFCVAYSALDARRLGFEVMVVLPACRAIDLDGSLATQLEAMQSAGISLSHHLPH